VRRLRKQQKCECRGVNATTITDADVAQMGSILPEGIIDWVSSQGQGVGVAASSAAGSSGSASTILGRVLPEDEWAAKGELFVGVDFRCRRSHRSPTREGDRKNNHKFRFRRAKNKVSEGRMNGDK
jgi:hypothetical protein